MTDKTHQLIGLTVATGAYLFLTPDVAVTLPIALSVAAGAVLGSLMPDIDQPTASIWNRIPLGGVFGQIVSECLGGHRNLSHSLLGVYLFSFFIRWLGIHIPEGWLIDADLFIRSAMIGFIAHLLADAVTVMGIPLLWPLGRNMGFPPHPLHGIRIVTGKWFENAVVFPFVLILLISLIWNYSERFCLLIPWVCK